MAGRRLRNVPDAELDDYVDDYWDDIRVEAKKADADPDDFLAAELVRRHRLDRFGPVVLERIDDGGILYSEDAVERAAWMGGVLDAIEERGRGA